MRSLFSLGLVALAGGLFSLGCSPLTLGVQSRRLSASTVLAGRLSGPIGWNGPIVVVAWAERHGRLAMSRYRLLREAGEFALIVPNGIYRLGAFGDINGNLACDPGEPAGRYAGFRRLKVSGGVVSPLDFDLSEVDPKGLFLPPVLLLDAPPPPTTIEAGAVVRLEEDRFSKKSGREGYWTPRTTLERTGANVYFLEPYDPRRTPVLFVHGATGTPRDWQYFIEHLDRSRFQAWVYSYPSGTGIDTLSDLLYWKLSNLKERFGFPGLHIAAHSMGGLVVRSLLGKYRERLGYVGTFASFSTPWGGEQLARLAPASVVSWADMRPKGAFLTSLFQRELPAEVDFYLFFGYRGSRSLLRPANDGTVTLKSELAPPAQAEARQVFGFAEDHASILASTDVVTLFNALLIRHSSPGGPLYSRTDRAPTERDVTKLVDQQ